MSRFNKGKDEVDSSFSDVIEKQIMKLNEKGIVNR